MKIEDLGGYGFFALLFALIFWGASTLIEDAKNPEPDYELKEAANIAGVHLIGYYQGLSALRVCQKKGIPDGNGLMDCVMARYELPLVVLDMLPPSQLEAYTNQFRTMHNEAE